MPPLSRTLAASLLLALGGCAVGPEFTRPEAPNVGRIAADKLPTETTGTTVPTGDAQRFLEGMAVPERWWKEFGNAELDRRVAQALAHNPSVAAAEASLRAARASAAAAGALLPQLDAGVGAAREDTVGAGAGGPYTVYNASVNVSYDLDLFGANRRQNEAEDAVVAASLQQLQGAYLSLAANVATASLTEAALGAQLVASDEIVAALTEQESLAQTRHELGATSLQATLAARSQLAAAKAARLPIERQLAEIRNQLAVYLGEYPAEFEAANTALDDFTLPAELPVSLPSELVRQRPDILAAEAELHRATAELGIATANLLPRITLTGAWGSRAADASDLFGANNILWNLAGGLLQPLFHGGDLRAARDAAEARLALAAAQYRVTVLNAFGEVANVLRALQIDADALAAQARSRDAAKRNLELVQTSYDTGAASYLEVLDATRQYQQATLAFIQARTTRLADTVALYAALGGGWNTDTNARDTAITAAEDQE